MYIKVSDMEKLNIAIQYANQKLGKNKTWQSLYKRATGVVVSNAEKRAISNERIKKIISERRKFDRAYGRGNIVYKKDNAVEL